MVGIRAWMSAPRTIFGLFVASVVVTYLIPKHTQWLPRPNAEAVPVALSPIPNYLWQTSGWIVLIALFITLLRWTGRGAPDDWPDLSARRMTLLALAGLWSFALVSRIVTGKASEASITPLALVIVAGVVGAAAFMALRPPRTSVVIGGVLLGGVVARLVGITLTPLDKDYSDNLPAILVSLDRLVHGQTPYAMIDFGTHLNPMGYLPWTVLGYLPPFIAGVDIRFTNLVLSLAVVVSVLLFLARLGLPRKAEHAFGLLAALIYAAPNAIGFDLHTEWQFFTLALVSAFALLGLGRLRIAAASYGLALGAMPVAALCAPALCGFVIRTKGWREFVSLSAIAAAFASPIVIFLLWDANAFLGTVTSAPLSFAQRLAAGDPSWPYLLAWHRLPYGALSMLQLGISALVVFLSWRTRTPSQALRLAVATYLALTLTPFIAPHVFSPLLWLVMLAIALRVAERTIKRGADLHGLREGRHGFNQREAAPAS